MCFDWTQQIQPLQKYTGGVVEVLMFLLVKQSTRTKRQASRMEIFRRCYS